MTDVNVAVEMIGDAHDDVFDTAIIVSGDGDLTGPLSAIRRRHPGKRVVAAFLPNRSSFRLRGAATASLTIDDVTWEWASAGAMAATGD